MIEKPINRMDALSKIVAFDDKQKFERIIDYPIKGSIGDVDLWYATLKTQTEKAIKVLLQPRLPIAEMEDQNLLNYLELLMGKEMTPFPRVTTNANQEV